MQTNKNIRIEFIKTFDFYQNIRNFLNGTSSFLLTRWNERRKRTEEKNIISINDNQNNFFEEIEINKNDSTVGVRISVSR